MTSKTTSAASVPPFKGFTPQAPALLEKVWLNNSKEWFLEHRAQYDELVLNPLRSLAASLSPLISSLDPQAETAPKVGKAISRIYRDTRFSKDKSVFRPAMWLAFKRRAKDFRDVPCFYFELTNVDYRYGVGFYECSAATAAAWRAAIDLNPKAYLKIFADLAKHKEFAVCGEEYKRPKRADLEPGLKGWYNRKNFYVNAEFPLEGDIYAPRLLGRLERAFTRLTPLYQAFVKAAESKQQTKNDLLRPLGLKDDFWF